MFSKRLFSIGLLLAACGKSPDSSPFMPDAGDQPVPDASDVVPDAAQLDAAVEDEVANLLGRIDGDRLWNDLEALVGLGQRSDHAGQEAAAAYIRGELAGLAGATVYEHEYAWMAETWVNFEITIPGADPDTYVMMGAHYDSTSESPGMAPGADDNASGAAAVLEAARVFAGGPTPEISVRLVLFSNEERGTVGSQQYAAYLAAQVPTEDVVGFINVDMIAYGDDGEDLDLATRPDHADFLHDTADAVVARTSLEVDRIIDDHCG